MQTHDTYAQQNRWGSNYYNSTLLVSAYNTKRQEIGRVGALAWVYSRIYICMCIYLCRYAYIYICMCISIHSYIYICICKYIHIYIQIHIHECIYIYIYIYVFIYVYICMHFNTSLFCWDKLKNLHSYWPRLRPRFEIWLGTTLSRSTDRNHP